MAKTNFFLVNRSILDHWLWEDKPFSKGQAWIDLMALANYKDKKIERKGRIVSCKRGEVNMSVLSLSKRWGWTRGRTERFLKLLEFDGMVRKNSTTGGTTLTIENYNMYQDLRATDDATDKQQTDNKRTTDEQQTDTTKERKRKIKKVKNNIYNVPACERHTDGAFANRRFEPPTLKQVEEYCQERDNSVDAERFIDFYESKGWMVGKNKMKDWKAAVRNWERNKASKSVQSEDAGRLGWIDEI